MIERDDLTFCPSVMVELRTRKREMRGYEGNHHEKLRLKRISCASQFTIPDTAGTSIDLAWNNTSTSSSKPHQTGCTTDFPYPLIITSFSSSSPIPLCLVHMSTLITEHKVKSSLSSLPCHNHQLMLSTAYT